MVIDEQKFQKRATAYKIAINDINSGEYISDDFGSYLKNLNLKITRVRIMGTVIKKREYAGGENPDLSDGISERSDHTFLVLDDGTGTIRLKTWKKDIEMLDRIAIGDIIDTVARIRKYQDEIYIVPEFVKKIDDPNWELVRELEIMKLKNIYLNNIDEIKEFSSKTPEDMKEKKSESDEIKDSDVENDLKKQILIQLKMPGHSKGLTREELYEIINTNKIEINECINELMTNGNIFEQPNGKIKEA